ncbi:MAG: outer membrane beta-barrel protein [Longimicrobiales bacterium]
MRNVVLSSALSVLALGYASNVAAQDMSGPKLAVEVRAVAVVPTFDIADAADVGPGFGVGLGYRVADRVSVMGDFDMGMHPTPTPDFDINTLHFMAKVGYDVYTSERVTVSANLGAGAVQFGGDLPEAKTYFAINAGAKVAIALSSAIDLLVSPQGDIAFSKEADLGTSNAWVWPIGVGLRFHF